MEHNCHNNLFKCQKHLLLLLLSIITKTLNKMQQNTYFMVATENCFAFCFAFPVIIEDIGCNSYPIAVHGTSALTARNNTGSQYSNAFTSNIIMILILSWLCFEQ